MNNGPAIELDHVTKSFDAAGDVALDAVSLVVKPREFVTIVGPSGSGKTTLLRLINRLIDPTDGVVRFAGEDVRGVDPIALRRRTGYVFQGVGLFPHLTVAENIAVTPKLLGWDRKRIDTRVDELIRLVRLDPATYRDRFPHQLSGGERQRIGVARAIAAEPGVVLMDEPFGALDPLTREAVSEDYRRLHDQLGLTTVMITHDMLEALLLADRIVVLRGGKIIAEGAPQDLMTGQQDDYVRELMQTPRRLAERLQVLIARGAS